MQLVKSICQSLALVSVGVLGLPAAQATPTPLISPPPLTNGFQVEWARVDTAPHSIADAVNALNGSGGFTVLNRVTQTLNTIDVNDASVPFAGADPLFAVRVSGYVTLAAGRYSFSSLHDDGVRVTVGGEQVITFDSDTAAVETDSALFDLAAGVYAYEAISWEQGGAFNLRLGLLDAAGAGNLLVGQHATSIPEPASLGLAGFGLLAAAGVARRARRAKV